MNVISLERDFIVENVLPQFGMQQLPLSIEIIGSGLINRTWKIIFPNDEAYILQQLNSNVFLNPKAIAVNIERIASFLQQHAPTYLFTAPVKATNGESLIELEDKVYYRMFSFVKGSVTKDVVTSPTEAYEAAKQFAKFTYLLSGFDAGILNISIPSFHNLSLRYQQFLAALEVGNKNRIEETAAMIAELKQLSSITEQFDAIASNPACKLRVTHHDTKISNVLFNEQGKGLCVIDLDTVMPGYFISDVGDMMRTYLPPVSEEESDYTKIELRTSYFEAIVQGYCQQMKTELTADELNLFVYAGKFMIYMQALRFLTDYINDDVYYGARYPKHNLVRAGNQLVLLQKFLQKETELLKIVKRVCAVH